MPAPSRAARFLRPGPILMGLGALILLAGVIQTTSSTSGGGNQTCPGGTSLIAKFNYDHGYEFDSPSGNSHVVTLSHASADGANWSSTTPVVALIVKGGPGAVLYSISPAQTSGTFSNHGLPKVGHGNTPDVSNVQFCGSNVPPTSSTTSSTTSTTSSTTSTSTTSTTVAPTTTTTTHAPPSTTCHCETTTTHAPPSTTCGCSTTTTHPTTTTTMPHETTTVPATTTSTTQVSSSTLVITTTTRHGVTTTTKERVGAATTEVGQGSTTSFGPSGSSTSVIAPNDGGNLPFTGSSSWPLVGLGVILLATGLTLTLSQSRRRERSA